MEIPLAIESHFKLAAVRHKGVCAVAYCRNKSASNRSILCPKHRMELWRARNPKHAAFRVIKDRAKRKGIEFLLTLEEFFELCDLTDYHVHKGTGPLALSLDRIDPTRGYELDNLRVVTVRENSRKGSYERRLFLRDGRFAEHREIGLDGTTIEELACERRKTYVGRIHKGGEPEEQEPDGTPVWLDPRSRVDTAVEDNEPF